MKSPKVALVHDYLVQYGGAEKTLEAISELFPDAPIYTSSYKPANFVGTGLEGKKVIHAKGISGFFNAIPILSKYLTFLRPIIFEGFDLREYDLIISDSSSYAKGVLTKPHQLHISYIHTPPRFLYGYSVESTKRTAWYYAPVVMVVDHLLRMWDFAAAQRPDFLAVNSEEIRGRVKKFYNRDATVIYPPVELAPDPDTNSTSGKDDYYLVAGRLVAYKNFDAVIEVFNDLPELNLYVVGGGPEERYLKNIAEDNIIFLGRVTEEQKHELMQNCLGLINAVQDEDFGIVPIEVMSHGRPVLAHKSAGHLETVQEGVSGMFFEYLDLESLRESIVEFDKKVQAGDFDEDAVKDSVQKFSKKEFKDKFKTFVLSKWEKHTK